MEFVPTLTEEDKAYCRLKNISPDQYIAEQLFEFASSALRNGRIIKLDWDTSVSQLVGTARITSFTIRFDLF